MIDIKKEELRSLKEIAQHNNLPRRRNGKPPHPSTLYRWATDGVDGVHLEILRCGSTTCTSLEAVQRFFEKLTLDTSGQRWLSGHWLEDAEHSVADWKYEVANDDTRQGYSEWVTSQRELKGEKDVECQRSNT